MKIGAILPLTGGGAEWGITSKNALELALKKYNINSTKLKIEILYEDSKTNSKDALNALNKLISQDVKIIIGDIISSNVLVMAPIIEKNKMLLISPGASNPDISNAGEYIFRTWQSDALEAKIGVNYILDSLKWQKIALLYLENGYGSGIAQEFKNLLKNKGIEPILTESFKVGQQNFKDILTKLRSVKPDGIYIASYPEENLLLLKQMQELRLNFNVMGTQGFVSDKIEKIWENLTFPIVYSIPIPPDSSAESVKGFLTDYVSNYGTKPGITADASYDAFNLVIQFVEKYGIDTDKIKNALYNVKDYPGASGILTFNKYGDVEKPFKFIKNSYFINKSLNK
ncbi:MAG: ABC transporter substrate-binding protein [Candidatus Lokiarchaeota archaeon]|nr:ABC transporter substrate-binding protein [Candidatus Lokiarchaeota archaeon]